MSIPAQPRKSNYMDIPNMAPAESDPNRHVKDYLTFFLNLPHAPHYAVLINGPWGIGKTYLVKQFLKKEIPHADHYVYISLFGVRARDEIDTALFGSIYPALGSKTAKLGGRILKTALKYGTGIEFDMSLKEVITRACLP
jgi:KAP family P-loop domain